MEYTNSVLGTTEEFICSSRPRRFGKSIAAAMLAAYYSRGCDSEKMLSGASVEVDVSSFQNDTISFAGKDDVLTYLIHLGYLAYHQDERTAFIPNEEIRQELTAATKRKKWDER